MINIYVVLFVRATITDHLNYNNRPRGQNNSMSSLKDNAYQIIKQRIIDATYPAQTFIDERALAQELNTSRTPIREALIALSQEGYLQILPKRGIIVLPFTYQDAVDIFQVRRLLEPWLVRTYGPSLTEEELKHERELVIEEINAQPPQKDRPGISMHHHPHILLIEKCTNRNIRKMLDYSEQQIERIPDTRRLARPYVNVNEEAYKEQILADHLRLIDLMLAGDFEGAAKDMEWHVQHAEEEYMSFWFG